MKARRSIAIGARLKSFAATTRRALALRSRATLFWRKGARGPAVAGSPASATTIRQGANLSWRIGIRIVHRHPLRTLAVPATHPKKAAPRADARPSPIASPVAARKAAPSPRQAPVGTSTAGTRNLENSKRVRRGAERSRSASPPSRPLPTTAPSVRRLDLHTAAHSLRQPQRLAFHDASDHPLPPRPRPQAWRTAATRPAPLAPRAQELVWNTSAHAMGDGEHVQQRASFTSAVQRPATAAASTACTPAEAEAIAQRQIRAARPAAAAWDSGTADRIAGEVMRRVEKNLRIERERRGR
ncbi:MAG: hypothetical protein ABWY34_11930 [Pseudoxanthomonas sp.]